MDLYLSPDWGLVSFNATISIQMNSDFPRQICLWGHGEIDSLTYLHIILMDVQEENLALKTKMENNRNYTE